MANVENNTSPDQETRFSWKETLKRVSKPVTAALAAIAVAAAGYSVSNDKEKIDGTPVAEGKTPTSTEAPLDPTPPASESIPTEHPAPSTTEAAPTNSETEVKAIEAEPSFEAASGYALDFATEAVGFIPETAHVDVISDPSDDPMLTDYEVRYAPEGSDTLPADGNTRSYVLARIDSTTHQVTVSSALETSSNEVIKRVSTTFEMAPDHPFFMSDAPVWGGTFANEVFANPDKLAFMELTLTNKEDSPSTVAVGLGETGTPAFFTDTIGTPLPPGSKESFVFNERLATADYMNGLQSDIFAELG